MAAHSEGGPWWARESHSEAPSAPPLPVHMSTSGFTGQEEETASTLPQRYAAYVDDSYQEQASDPGDAAPRPGRDFSSSLEDGLPPVASARNSDSWHASEGLPANKCGKAKGGAIELNVTAGPVRRSSDKRLKPSRTASMRRRHRRQLLRLTKDQVGVCVPDSGRPFSLWASPAAIGEACAGLGVFFASLKWLAWLAVVLAVLCIYPVVGNALTTNWGYTYQLQVSATPEGTCVKPWDVSGWITDTTPGARCASSIYSGPYDCPATCSYDPAQALAPGCAAAPSVATASIPGNLTWAGGWTPSCLLHLPCTDGADANAADGACHCCTLGLDVPAVEANPGVSPGQLWVLLLGQVLMLAWLALLGRAQRLASNTGASRLVTASDYTVLIKGAKLGIQSLASAGNGAPEGLGRPDPALASWAGRWGTPVGCFSVPTVGDALRAARKVEELQARVAEAEALAADRGCCGLGRWLYRALALGGSAPRLRRRLEAAQLKLSIYQRQAVEPTGDSFVSFAYAAQAQACAHANRRSLPQLAGDAAGCGARRDCCCCASAAPLLAGARVQVTRAPEPSDIIWEHTSVAGGEAALRRAWSLLLTACIVAAGAALQYGLAVAGERQRSNMLATLHAPEDSTDLDWSSLSALVDSALHNTGALRALSVLSGVAVVLVNWAITAAVRALSVYERWHTRTALERWVTLRLCLAYLVNATAVPLLAAHLSGSTQGWYSRGGLVESAFWVQVANALLVPAVMVLDPLPLLRAHVLSRFARTQAMMDCLLAPPPFPLAEEAASAVTTLGMAVWWAPVLPLSPAIAAVGLFLSYWADKWVALRRAASPGRLGGSALAGVVGPWLRALPLVQGVLMRFLYFVDYGSAVPVFWTGLALWLLFALAALRWRLAARNAARPSAAGALHYWETIGAFGGNGGGCVDERFAPEVPEACDREFRQRVEAAFALCAAPPPELARSPSRGMQAQLSAEQRSEALRSSLNLSGSMAWLAPPAAASAERGWPTGALGAAAAACSPPVVPRGAAADDARVLQADGPALGGIDAGSGNSWVHRLPAGGGDPNDTLATNGTFAYSWAAESREL